MPRRERMPAVSLTCAAVTAARSGLALAAAAVIAVPGPAAASPGWKAAGSGAPPSRQAVGGPLLAGGGVVVRYPSQGALRLPRVPAGAYVIADAGSGRVLAAKDAHGLFPPASTLKVLTAITLIPRLNPYGTVVASRLATSVQPNIVGLRQGRRYQIADLFRALLLISANDAAVALAQATGSLARGVALMNAEARRLQAYDVVARNPNGLPAAGQHASAYDEALIARQALAMPAFMAYDSTLAARFPVRPHRSITMVNQNSLLTGYRGGIGGKIGWTVAAEATYIGMARRNGVTLIVTVLHCTPLQEITSAERLLSWGFTMADRVRPVGTLVAPAPAAPASPVTRGASAGPSRPPAAHRQAGARAAPRQDRHGPRLALGAASALGAGAVAAAAIGAAGVAALRRRASRAGRGGPGRAG